MEPKTVSRPIGSKNRRRLTIGLPEISKPAEQESAFPSAETSETIADNPTAAKISSEAKEKEKILEASKQIPEIFTPEQVEWVFDVYVAILCFAYSLVLKTEFAELQDELEFSKEQKELMSKPLAKILSKHAPPSWAGMSSEIELIMLMGVWTVASIQRARNVAKKQQEKKRDAERTRPVAPIRERGEIHVPA